jgi:hypothetical protein
MSQDKRACMPWPDIAWDDRYRILGDLDPNDGTQPDLKTGR